MRAVKRRKSNNKGFSLIEVLMAVVLLGLIAAPLLQMFYSSFAMNKKSEKYLAAADLLQTVMEGVSSQTWEDSKPVVSGATTVPGLKTYYTGLSSGAQKTINSTGDVPIGTFSSGVNGNMVTFKFSDVSYGGYKFNVEIKVDKTAEKGSGYYAFPVTVRVLDEKNHLIQSATTQVQNKR